MDRVDPDAPMRRPSGDRRHAAPELRVPADAPLPRPGGRARGFDASEGTDKDPLKNKTFDLSNPEERSGLCVSPERLTDSRPLPL